MRRGTALLLRDGLAIDRMDKNRMKMGECGQSRLDGLPSFRLGGHVDDVNGDSMVCCIVHGMSPESSIRRYNAIWASATADGDM